MQREPYTPFVINCWSMGGRGRYHYHHQVLHPLVLQGRCAEGQGEGGEEGGRDLTEPGEVQEGDRELPDCFQGDEAGGGKAGESAWQISGGSWEGREAGSHGRARGRKVRLELLDGLQFQLVIYSSRLEREAGPMNPPAQLHPPFFYFVLMIVNMIVNLLFSFHFYAQF